MVLSGGKRAKREADSAASHLRKDEASRNSNVVGNVTNNDLTPPPKGGPKDHPCRFCDKTFEKSQALGGHMNKHRAEKEEEGLKKARSLVESKQVLFGNIPWSNYGGGGGVGNHLQYGQTFSTNAHIVGTSMPPQSYPNLNQSTPIQQNQMQMNQSIIPQQQIQVHGHQGGIIRGSHLRSLENSRTHLNTPSQTEVLVSGQHQVHHGTWVNSGQHPGQMAYPGQHGGTDFHVPHQLHQAGPSQQLQDIGQSSMASYTLQFPQDQSTGKFVELAQIHQPAQYCYDVQHPNQYGMYQFHAPQDGSQTSIDEKSDSLRNQMSVNSDNQTVEHHILHEGTDHNVDPVRDCGAQTPDDKVGDQVHGFQ